MLELIFPYLIVVVQLDHRIDLYQLPLDIHNHNYHLYLLDYFLYQQINHPFLILLDLDQNFEEMYTI